MSDHETTERKPRTVRPTKVIVMKQVRAEIQGGPARNVDDVWVDVPIGDAAMENATAALAWLDDNAIAGVNYRVVTMREGDQLGFKEVTKLERL